MVKAQGIRAIIFADSGNQNSNFMTFCMLGRNLRGTKTIFHIQNSCGKMAFLTMLSPAFLWINSLL